MNLLLIALKTSLNIRLAVIPSDNLLRAITNKSSEIIDWQNRSFLDF
jgi:hypothetical protein